jgi:hypothetical protein
LREAIKELRHQNMTLNFNSVEQDILRDVLDFTGQSIMLSHDQWYQIKRTLSSFRGERKTCLNAIRSCKYTWTAQVENDIESYSKLIKKIDLALYESEYAVQQRFDEQPKWIQQQARKRPVPCSFSRAR